MLLSSIGAIGPAPPVFESAETTSSDATISFFPPAHDAGDVSYAIGKKRLATCLKYLAQIIKIYMSNPCVSRSFSYIIKPNKPSVFLLPSGFSSRCVTAAIQFVTSFQSTIPWTSPNTLTLSSLVLHSSKFAVSILLLLIDSRSTVCIEIRGVTRESTLSLLPKVQLLL